MREDRRAALPVVDMPSGSVLPGDPLEIPVLGAELTRGEYDFAFDQTAKVLRCSECEEDSVVPADIKVSNPCERGGRVQALDLSYMKQGIIKRRLPAAAEIPRHVLKSIEKLETDPTGQ